MVLAKVAAGRDVGVPLDPVGGGRGVDMHKEHQWSLGDVCATPV